MPTFTTLPIWAKNSHIKAAMMTNRATRMRMSHFMGNQKVRESRAELNCGDFFRHVMTGAENELRGGGA